MTRFRILCLPVLYLLVSQCFAQILTDDEPTRYPKRLQAFFEAPVASAQCFAVYNVTLLAAVNGENGVEIYRYSMSASETDPQIEQAEITGLPAGFRIETMVAIPLIQQLAAAGQLDGKPAIFKANLDPKANLSPFQQMEAIPSTVPEQFTASTSQGTYGFFFTNRETPDGIRQGGWAGNIGTADSLFSWIDIPTTRANRQGSAFLAAREQILQCAGVTPATDERDSPAPVTFTEAIPFDKPNFGTWDHISMPTSPRLGEAISATFGAGHYIANRNQQPDDEATSMTMFLTVELPSGEMSYWERIQLDQPAQPITHVAIDPGHAHLLVFTRPDDERLEMSGYKVPSFIVSSGKSEAELTLEYYEKIVPYIAAIPKAEALEKGRANNQYVLFMVSNGQREEDLTLRMRMRNPAPRYMMMNTTVSYLKGEEAREIMADYQIESTPAFLLVDPDGNLVRQHVGSIPSQEQLFEVTSPSRHPMVEPGDE